MKKKEGKYLHCVGKNKKKKKGESHYNNLRRRTDCLYKDAIVSICVVLVGGTECLIIII